MADIKEQILKYEAEHTVLFINLVIANILWLKMPGKYGFDPKNKQDQNGAKYNAWVKMGKTIVDTLAQWKLRQDVLEKIPGGNVPKMNPDVFKSFLKPEKIKYLYDIAMTMIKPGTAGKGLGFIPLLIWGVIAIAGFLTAAYIINQTTTTAQEKEHLLQTTKDTLKELNIPPDKAASIISETQEQASENKGLFDNLTGGGTGKLLLAGAVIFFLMNKRSSKVAA